jgi:hypothetical protein
LVQLRDRPGRAQRDIADSDSYGPDYAREAWLARFLGANPGVGQLEAEDEEWTPTRREAVAALCRHRLDTGEKVLPLGSPGATYRASRGLPEAASAGML